MAIWARTSLSIVHRLRNEQREHHRRHEQHGHHRDAADDLDVAGAEHADRRQGRAASERQRQPLREGGGETHAGKNERQRQAAPEVARHRREAGHAATEHDNGGDRNGNPRRHQRRASPIAARAVMP